MPFYSFQFWSCVGMLLISNVFMTFAWYGHLKFKASSLWLVILVSWGIAFFEYCLQVPANRIGSDIVSPSQLKMIQEVVTFFVFSIFSWWYLGQPATLNDYVAFALIAGAVGISLFRPF